MFSPNQIDDELRSRVPAADAELIVRFSHLFLAGAPPEFFRDRTPSDIAELVAGSFRHLQESRPGRVDVEVVVNAPHARGATTVRTNLRERPFIVATVREYLYAHGLAFERFLHPVLHVERDADGNVTAIGPATEPGPLESLIYGEVPRVDGALGADVMREGIRQSLQDAVAVTDDFAPMLAKLDETAASLDGAALRMPERAVEVAEVGAFLHWLRNNFVFLGYDAWGRVDQPDGGLGDANGNARIGLLRDDVQSRRATPIPSAREAHDQYLKKLGSAAASRQEAPVEEASPAPKRWPPRLLVIAQTAEEATVHRRTRMHAISIRGIENDEIVGERRFLGLFRSRAYAEEAQQIPILRHKLRLILEKEGWLAGSHDQREAVKIFNSMPKEELFSASAAEIAEEIKAILAQYYAQEVKVALRPDAAGGAVSIMIIMPADRYSGRVRRALQAALVRELEGTLLNYNLVMGGGAQARLHFQIAAPEERLAAVTASQIEVLVHEVVQTWTELLERHLARTCPPDEAHRKALRWGAAFSTEYRASSSPAEAAADLGVIEAMEADDRLLDVRLSNRPMNGSADTQDFTWLNVYVRGDGLVLSDFMPILEHLGLRVLSMRPFDATDEQGGARIYVFSVQDREQRQIDLDARGELLKEAILAVAAGDAADDGLNALVLTAGLRWRQVDILRVYSEFAFQCQIVPARQALPRVLNAHPEPARLLVDVFRQKFDPAAAQSKEERRQRIEEARSRMLASLESVTSLNDDRSLRRMLTLIDATVRTNYYVHGGEDPTKRSGGVPYISIKILSELLQSLVPTRLMAEVWVQSPKMAGTHLRAAKVARGGLRHSDRPDDVRTEVMGLVRTQAVKNAVIVPAGSKGGFVTPMLSSATRDVAAEVQEQYRTFIRGLLDITDNLVDSQVVRAPGLVVHDDNDPYLVVAADKGTAKFSDIANAVAAEYSFWLDDAFASGGSNGYSHKDVGITARGAWECVRRHFREMGRDTQTEPFTVVGIGDMSGDVFGNGMLRSRMIRLVAAFDHRHIFVDPDPDPERSFVERERLAGLGRSSWDDYDRSVMSEGGFVVPRGQKEITLTPQARAALGLPDDVTVMDGESLIRAILSAPVDLLWNGGIGTYVKAPEERHADVGDTANDAVRIDATDLRCKVLGEGGNLGLTQRARIRYALDGGRCNTDAIDNSGGVEMSDREVNLKILLNAAVAEGRLDRDARNRLLHELTDAVTEKVLHDNRSQSLAISLDLLRAGEGFQDYQGFMTAMEQRGVFERAAEALPTLETLVDRQSRGQSLARPELAVLLAYSKLSLKQALLAGDALDDPAMARYMADYFPERAVEVAGTGPMASHRLRREIIATQLCNDMVDLMGSAFVYRVARDTGHTESDIARAWFAAASLAGADELRRRLEELEGEVPSQVVYRWLLGLSRVLERTTRWILTNVPLGTPITDVVSRYLEGVTVLRRDFRSVVVGHERELFERLTREAGDLTRSEDVAASLITLRFLDQLLGIVEVAHETGADPLRAGRAFYLLSDLLELGWLRQAIQAAVGNDGWEQRAAHLLDEDVRAVHRRLTASAVANAGANGDVAGVVNQLMTRDARALEAYRAISAELKAEERPTLAALITAVREMEGLGAGS